MPCAAKDIEARALGCARNFLADPHVPLFARIDTTTQPDSLLYRTLLAGFANYAPDLFAFISYPFAQIGFGFADRSDFSGNLSDYLLVNSLDGNLVRSRDFELNPLRGTDNHGVGISHRRVNILALESSTIANADNFRLRT